MARGTVALGLALLLLGGAAAAAPRVFWASDPVRPGETVVLVGADLATAQVTVSPDAGRSARAMTVLQAAAGSLKFVLPADLKPGRFLVTVAGTGGKTRLTLNRPVAWWAQGEGCAPAPGRKLWVLGKCLGGRASLVLVGPRTVKVSAQGDAFACSATLPADLPPGAYALKVELAPADTGSVSEPITVEVQRPLAFPQKRFSVKDYGAEGLGQANDTEAIRAAIAAAEQAGGGVVYFPRGRYQVTDTIKLPRLVTLRGERRDLVNIFWPDSAEPPAAQLSGTNSFALEDLTFYCGNYTKFLVAEDRQPTAGNVRLDRITVRADRYRGHMKPEEVDRRFRSAGGNGSPLLTLGGSNVSITSCDLYSSGMAFWLTRLRNAYLADNVFSNGRHGWYSLSGNDGVIFARNTVVGGDLMSTGGGLNCLDGSKVSRHVYYAHNTLRTMFGWDREAMTSDAGGGAYYGKVAAAGERTVTLADDPQRPGDWLGGTLYILDGTGAGQYRVVTACSGREVTVERPWTVPPDATSTVTWCAYQGRCLFLDNDFTDAGVALQLYGNAVEHILAGNRSTRTAGFHNFGMKYSGGIQPNWYIQWLDNQIREGNVYWGDHDNWRLSGEAHIGVYTMPPASNWAVPLTLGTMVRRNHLDNNAHIMLGCEWTPGNLGRTGRHLRDVVVEGNSVSDADLGIYAFDTCEGLVLRSNRFTRVERPLDGPGLGKAYIPPAERSQAFAQTLQSLAAELGVKTDVLAEAKLKALLVEMANLPSDSPKLVSYQARATRELLLAVAKARPEGLPLKAVAPYLGLSAVMPWSAPLHNHLQGRPAGGPSRLDIDLTSSGVLPEALGVTATLQPPPGWQATPSAPVQVTPGTPAQVQIPVVVPAGAWAANLVPVTFNVSLGGPTGVSGVPGPTGAAGVSAPTGTAAPVLKVTQTFRVGSGFVTAWQALGPFPNKTGLGLDRALWPPDEGIDLKAQYDGAAGKIGWQVLTGKDFDNGFWPNLGRALQAEKGGTAYLLAGVTSARALPAEVRLVSSGGAAVIVNGEVAGSSDKPGSFVTPISLRAGDNALLLKLTAPAGEWKELCELGPAPDGPPLNEVTVIPPEAFAQRPVFTAPRPAAPAVGEIRHPGGVDWKLLYADDFSREALGPRWQVGSGKWTLEGGVLRSSGVAFLCYAEKVAAPVRVEYEARVAGSGASDVSACWLARPDDHASGLLLGFGSNGNTLNKLVVDGAQVAQSDRPLVRPGTWHHVIAQVLPTGRAQLIVDDELSLEQAVTPGAAKYPGLWAWDSSGEFRRVRIFTK